MLIESTAKQNEDFFVEFKKRFNSFCQKAPLLISYEVLPNIIRVYENKTSEVDSEKEFLFEYEIDFEAPVKENINEIRTELIASHYPKFSNVIVEEVALSSQELNEKATQGNLDLENFTPFKKIKKRLTYTIEKVIIVRDELFVRCKEDQSCFRYQVKMPVTIFLRKLRALSEDEKYSFFTSKTQVINQIYDSYQKETD